MVLMPLLSRLLTLLVILTMPLFLARLTLIPIKSLSICFRVDRKSGSAGMPRPISYAVFCLKKKKDELLNLTLAPNDAPQVRIVLSKPYISIGAVAHNKGLSAG